MDTIIRNVEEQAQEIVSRTDDWIEARVDAFDPLTWSDHEKRLLRRKAFAELATYVYRAELSDVPPPDGVRQLLVDCVNDPEYRSLVARYPKKIHQYGYPIACVDKVGELSPETRSVFERTITGVTPWEKELPPFRRLDQLHLARMMDQPSPDHLSFEAVTTRTSINRPINPVTISRKGTYALTHVPMFYHSYGANDDRFTDEPYGYEYPETLYGLLLRFIAEDDPDLVGELLFFGALERVLPRELAGFALSWYMGQMSDDGCLEAPADQYPLNLPSDEKGVEGIDLGEWSDENHTWAKHYHQTLVASMLGRTLQEQWTDIDAEAPEKDIDHESAAKQLLELGQVLADLSEYKLRRAAESIEKLAGTPAAEAYSGVFQYAVQFLEDQRREDGTFGYWTDEKYLFLSIDDQHDEAQFHDELVDDVSTQCERALNAVQRGADTKPIR